MKSFAIRSTFITLLASVSLATTHALPQAAGSSRTANAPAATSTIGTNQAAKAAGKLYFGSATDNPYLNEDATYKAILSNTSLFGQLSPENAMKWDATEPEQGVFTFTNGDAIVALAQANGQIMRGHNTVWGSQLPSWVSSSGFNNATLISVMQNHVSTVIGHYKGKIWDVVNEPFNEDGSFASNVFFDTIGPTYIDLALQAARKADPNAKLYINDFNIEGEGTKATAMANLVSGLKSRGIPIDGVGLESHFILGELPTTIQAQMEAFTALGVEVAVTELDIRMTLPETNALLARQQTDYETVISACNAVEKCVGVTIWEYTDKYSWVPGTFAGQGAADPWDEKSVVDVDYAQYEGIFDPNTNVTNFFGIRYAAPPTGQLRFRAPQPPAHVEGIQVADTEPPECVQGLVTDSEDCLFLNVHIPGNRISHASSLPTVVWIHGGGYLEEMGRRTLFRLLQEATTKLSRFSRWEGGEKKWRSQCGLMFEDFFFLNEPPFLTDDTVDQHAALQWVHKNIAKFGGDPQKVTIWGAGSVLQHIIAQDGRTSPPLFRGAITSSTFLPSQYQFDDPIPEGIYNEVVTQSQCSSAHDQLACLRAADVATLNVVNSNLPRSSFFGTFTFVPVIDGDFITQRATIALREGKINGEALLAVTNTNEGVIFVDQTGVVMNTSAYAGQLFPRFGSAQDEQVANQYANAGTSTLDQINAIMGDSIFQCPSYYLLKAFHGRGFNVFKGKFAIPPALHGMDVNYYFPHKGPITFHNATFSASFSQSFLSFVISLDPNDKVDRNDDITPPWKMFFDEQTEMVFNMTAGNLTDIHPTTTDPDLLVRCSFWERVGALTGQ
ncbi:hypothetical protein D9757_012516 [Collybiopsis confluens]|uniref:Beta-xylanase n=1 Tax=Collybiopsis confluens TaxID=2823264 RepID=A0A8H5D2A3_9AGAR|nr:hypothetical protein D9757_012516 [Collybiopsis confluens]